MTTLSLCMIVKNEEIMLQGCLESIRNWVDEMIVVDTGSTDNTKAIAEACGATVYDFPWINDFAAARNFAKSKATCDYVLALDADERFYQADGPLLREKLEGQTTHVLFVKLTNAKSRFSEIDTVLHGDGAAGSPVLLPRILRNVPENVWQGKIHEVPLIPADAVMLPVNVVHLGGDVEWRQMHNKNQRNLEMLETVLSEGEHQGVLFWSYLASEYMHAGNKKKFFAAIEQGWKEAVETISNRKVCTIGNAILYPTISFIKGDNQKGLESLNFVIQNLEFFSTNPANALYTAISSTIEVDFPKKLSADIYSIWVDGADLLLDMRDIVYPEETLPDIRSVRAYDMKILGLIRLKRYDEALLSIQKSLEEAPNRQVTLLLQIECYLEQGNMEQCLLLLTNMLHGNSFQNPDVWVLSALVWLVLGYEDDASHAIQQASLWSKIPFMSRHRMHLLQGLIVRQLVLHGKPVAGRGAYGVLGAILAREPLESINEVPRSIITRVIDVYVEQNHIGLINRFFDHRAEHILPGIKNLVIEHLASLGLSVEDDGLLSPIVLFGNALNGLQSVFQSSSRYHVQVMDSGLVEQVVAIWNSYQEKSIEDILFGELSFLDDQEEDADTVLVQIRNIIEKEYTDKTKRLVLVWPTFANEAALVKEAYPTAMGLFHAEDPRVGFTQATLTPVAWEKMMSSNYYTNDQFDSFLYVNDIQLHNDPSFILSKVLAQLGEVYDPTMVAIWQKAYGEVSSDTIAVDENTQQILEKWQFITR